MIDCMLEKKPGNCQIYTLRIIGLLCPEFNTCLKYFMGHQFARNFEASSSSNDQHAYRPHRQAIDAAMLKLLMMES